MKRFATFRLEVTSNFLELAREWVRVGRRPLRMLHGLRRAIEQNCVIPTWGRWWPYGVAYRDFVRDVSVCYPVPLNLAVGWSRWLLHAIRFRCAPVSLFDRAILELRHNTVVRGREIERARTDGYDDGFWRGRAAGYEAGYLGAHRQMHRLLDRYVSLKERERQQKADRHEPLPVVAPLARRRLVPGEPAALPLHPAVGAETGSGGDRAGGRGLPPPAGRVEAVMDRKLILTVGLPRAGKSTWARTTAHPVVCPDEIRLALHGQRYEPRGEAFVWAIARVMVRALFGAGHPVVILDACNTTYKRRAEWLSPDEWTRSYSVFDTTAEECIARAAAQGDAEIIPVIERMAAQLEPPGPDEWS